jgi:hypothetical protein
MAFCSRGNDLRQARFPAAWRPVEENRTEPVRFNRPSEQFSGTQDVLLAQVFVERSGTHPRGKGRIRINASFLRIACAKKIVHPPSFRGARGMSNVAATTWLSIDAMKVRGEPTVDVFFSSKFYNGDRPNLRLTRLPILLGTLLEFPASWLLVPCPRKHVPAIFRGQDNSVLEPSSFRSSNHGQQTS